VSRSVPIIHPLNYYRTPRTGQLVIDKAAATRFIKNAIAQANDTISTNASDPGPGPSTTSHSHTHFGDESGNGNANDKAHDVRAPAKITEKMLSDVNVLQRSWVFAYKSCLFHQTIDFATKIFSVVLLRYPRLFFFLNPATQTQQQRQQQVSSNGLALPSSSNPYHCTSGLVLAGPGPVTAATTTNSL
jgi:hypothetical protein